MKHPGYTAKEWNAVESAYPDPPPVNVRAEQVQRIRQRLVNLRASSGTRLDNIDYADLSIAIEELIRFERDIRDKP
jgi:hypothetical protein